MMEKASLKLSTWVVVTEIYDSFGFFLTSRAKYSDILHHNYYKLLLASLLKYLKVSISSQDMNNFQEN